MIFGACAGGALSFADYKRYREASADLDKKMIDRMLRPEDVGRAARMLGMGRDGKDLLSHPQTEVESLMDFAMHDPRDGSGRTKVQAYIEDIGPDTGLEREMLEMRARSRTSLFRAEARDPSACTVELSDQLRGDVKNITIYDGGLSATLAVGNYIFVRIYSGGGLCMTSGITFPFSAGIAPTLIKGYSRMRARPNRRGPASRFALFFRMNRKYGQPVLFA